jgi:hypothetical protein
MGVGTFYDSHLFVRMIYSGNDAIGIDILSGGEMKKGVHLHIVGEMGGHFTGCKRIRSNGALSAYGRFSVNSFIDGGSTHQPPDKHLGGLFDFREEPMTWAGFNPTHNNQIGSAASLPVPSSGKCFLVTGNTTITSIGGLHHEGREITLIFAGSLTVTNGASLKLHGGVNLAATANDVLQLALPRRRPVPGRHPSER